MDLNVDPERKAPVSRGRHKSLGAAVLGGRERSRREGWCSSEAVEVLWH